MYKKKCSHSDQHFISQKWYVTQLAENGGRFVFVPNVNFVLNEKWFRFLHIVTIVFFLNLNCLDLCIIKYAAFSSALGKITFSNDDDEKSVFHITLHMYMIDVYATPTACIRYHNIQHAENRKAYNRNHKPHKVNEPLNEWFCFAITPHKICMVKWALHGNSYVGLLSIRIVHGVSDAFTTSKRNFRFSIGNDFKSNWKLIVCNYSSSF